MAQGPVDWPSGTVPNGACNHYRKPDAQVSNCFLLKGSAVRNQPVFQAARRCGRCVLATGGTCAAGTAGGMAAVLSPVFRQGVAGAALTPGTWRQGTPACCSSITSRGAACAGVRAVAR